MNSKTHLLSLLMLLSLKSIAQSPQSGCIAYQYIKNFGIEVTQTAYLVFANGQSVFVHSKGEKGNIMQSNKQEIVNGSIRNIGGGWHQDTFGVVFFKDLKAKRLVRREFFETTPYVAEEPTLPQMKWVITIEQKKIGSFNCQKATTRFRGRNYTAWFTMDIPISDGPWLLNGLPGLILEAIDDKKEVTFLFNAANLPNNSPLAIQLPTNGEKVDFLTYKKAGDIEFEKAQRTIMSESDFRGVTMSFDRNKTHEIELEFEQ